MYSEGRSGDVGEASEQQGVSGGKEGQRQGCGRLSFSPLTVLPLALQFCFNCGHRVVLCCVGGGWVALPWAAWVSHTRKTGRLDLKVQVSVSVPWV